MFILLTLGIFILKFLALGVVGLFFAEDLELTRSVGGGIYSAGTLTIAENAEVTGNSIINSGANGGGVYAAGGSVTLRDNAKITDLSLIHL